MATVKDRDWRDRLRETDGHVKGKRRIQKPGALPSLGRRRMRQSFRGLVTVSFQAGAAAAP